MVAFFAIGLPTLRAAGGLPGALVVNRASSVSGRIREPAAWSQWPRAPPPLFAQNDVTPLCHSRVCMSDAAAAPRVVPARQTRGLYAPMGECARTRRWPVSTTFLNPRPFCGTGGTYMFWATSGLRARAGSNKSGISRQGLVGQYEQERHDCSAHVRSWGSPLCDSKNRVWSSFFDFACALSIEDSDFK